MLPGRITSDNGLRMMPLEIRDEIFELQQEISGIDYIRSWDKTRYSKAFVHSMVNRCTFGVANVVMGVDQPWRNNTIGTGDRGRRGVIFQVRTIAGCTDNIAIRINQNQFIADLAQKV